MEVWLCVKFVSVQCSALTSGTPKGRGPCLVLVTSEVEVYCAQAVVRMCVFVCLFVCLCVCIPGN